MHFKSQKSNFLNSRYVVSPNARKWGFWFRSNSEWPQTWDSITKGLYWFTRLISILNSWFHYSHPSIFSIYVNSTTFSFSIGIIPKFILRYLFPKYGSLQNKNSKITPWDCIFNTGVFLSFFSISGVFLQISLSYLIFVF